MARPVIADDPIEEATQNTKKKFSPGPTIASRLRSMFGNKKQTVATALDGEVSGGGGGAVVTMNPETYMLVTMDGNPVSYNDIKKWGVVLYANIDMVVTPPDEATGLVLISGYECSPAGNDWTVGFNEMAFVSLVSADAPLYEIDHHPITDGPGPK